jgi:uncharacterized protein
MKKFRLLDPTGPRSISPGFCALAVMTKAPQAGHVKTRLVPPLTPDEAAELNKSFLRDTAQAISRVTIYNKASGIAVYTPTGTESAYDALLPDGFSLLPQRGVGFGERLYFAAEDLFRCGFESVCLIDSDSPTVIPKTFAKSVSSLQTHGDRVVLGPCDDGGYYLIGLKKPLRQLFEQIDWSTERVFDQTMRCAREIGLEVKLLPAGYDVDDAASLRRLCNEVLGDNVRPDIASYTRKFLRELMARKSL